ncbi:MAG: c-type cytochrome [Anaerolineae bacterium]
MPSQSNHPRWKILPRAKWSVLLPLLLVFILVVTWQVAHAQPPTPNAPIPGPKDVDFSANGPAPTMHGDPLNGRILFAADCARCHGDRGTGGVDNPGTDDGTIPPLNPIDPGFVEDSQGDPGIFARDIDLFLQHGSVPAGDDPSLQMPAWGDRKIISQSDIADTEAYVMQLNGVYWSDKWYPPAEVQMDASRKGNTVTYTINILNQGSSALGQLVLRDTLPQGVSVISTKYNDQSTNPAKSDSPTTVEWDIADIPSGGAAGPFTIVAGVTGNTVPPNVAQITFTFCTWNNHCMPASAVSDPVAPPAPVVAKPTVPSVAVVATATVVPTNTPTPAVTASETETETSPTVEETEAATEVPPTATPMPTAAPVVQALRPSNGNLTGGPALGLTGDAGNGAAIFAKSCKGCHGANGQGGVANQGAASGTIPALNPVVPDLKSADFKTFAYNLDLFIEHGSTPAGNNPLATMPAWGDTAKLTAQQIADVIAYIINLNP